MPEQAKADIYESLLPEAERYAYRNLAAASGLYHPDDPFDGTFNYKNIFIERLWRSLKYECIYLNEYENVPELLEGLRWWFGFYNEERPHTALPGRITPRSMYEKCLIS